MGDDPDLVAAIRELTGGGGETVVEAVGRGGRRSSWPTLPPDAAGRPWRAGLPAPDQKLSITPLSLVAEERTLKGSYMGSGVPRRDVPRLLALARDGRLPVERLVSGSLRLDEINAGFDHLADGSAVRQLLVFD